MFISIAIPFYNAEKYLADAIRSVFAQTYQNWELILIDDGSTDKSLEIAKSIKDPRVRVLSDGKNKKLAARLNEITQLAQYDYIARMDADDLMSPQRIEKQLNILNNNSHIDLVTCGNYSLSNSGEVKGVRWHNFTSINLNDLLNKKGSGVLHAAVLARKQWYMRNHYNESLKTAQDYELWVRASSKNDFNIYLMQEPLYYYREEGNVSLEKLLRAYSIERLLLKKYAAKNKTQLLMKSHIKTYVVKFLNIIKQNDLLLKVRSNRIDDQYFNVVNKELEKIKNTKVPGLN